MNIYLKYLIYAGLIYLIGVFSAADFNIANWGVERRGIIAFVMLITMIVVAMSTQHNKMNNLK